MKEKEPLVSSGDNGKDEDSAQVGPHQPPFADVHSFSLFLLPLALHLSVVVVSTQEA